METERKKQGPPKGVSNNYKGRTKGVKNKITTEVKDKLSMFIDGEFESFKAAYDSLDGATKAKLYLETVKLVLPKPRDPDEEEDIDRRHKELLDRIWPLN